MSKSKRIYEDNRRPVTNEEILDLGVEELVQFHEDRKTEEPETVTNGGRRYSDELCMCKCGWVGPRKDALHEYTYILGDTEPIDICPLCEEREV